MESKQIIEIKAVRENQALYVEGYAASFGNVDSYNDRIQKGAFVNTINGTNRDRIAFCKDHDLRDVIGVIVDIKEDERGLWFRAKVSKTRDGKDIEVLIEDGALKEFSIGFITKGYEWNEEESVRTLTEVELWEISLVTRAANDQAKLVSTEVKSEDDTRGLSDDELIERKNKTENELRLLEKEITKRILTKI